MISSLASRSVTWLLATSVSTVSCLPCWSNNIELCSSSANSGNANYRSSNLIAETTVPTSTTSATGSDGKDSSGAAIRADVPAKPACTSTPAKGVDEYSADGKPISYERYQAIRIAADALALMRDNQNDAAAAKLRKAIELAPDLAEAHHNLGLVLAKLGDIPQAINELNLAIKYKPDLDSSWLTLGGIHQSIGHIDQAVDIYRSFLFMFPKHPMHDKIVRLVDGLMTEKKGIQSAMQEDSLLSAGQSSNTHGVLQVPGQQASGDDDYLLEVTRNGILHWPAHRMPIKFFIRPAQDSRGNATVSGFRPEYNDVLIRAFKDWSQASNSIVKFEQVNDAHEANLICKWVDDPADLQNPSEAGEAQVTTDPDGIISGKITLLTKSISVVLPLTTNRLRVICLHEVGHVLGLSGHTTYPEDIMFYSTSFKDSWRELSGRDSRTIQRLYSNK